MQMEMEAGAENIPEHILDRLQAAAHALEQAADRLAAVELQASASREADLAERLTEAETTIATLRAQAATHTGRKTVTNTALTSKEGIAVEAGALDAALSTLSLEQRIAVKAQLLRSRILG